MKTYNHHIMTSVALVQYDVGWVCVDESAIGKWEAYSHDIYLLLETTMASSSEMQGVQGSECKISILCHAQQEFNLVWEHPSEIYKPYPPFHLYSFT
jgi:hypothetical protein